ncbi:hypothetical protein J4471_03110 [Candidatus Woesearchaeota archaeon]|nr:hypothetical protein [Candidatus Woesearchaeota archaeon]
MKFNKFMQFFIELIVIIIGLFTIFIIVKDVEISIGLFSLTFGILGIIWTGIAIKSLSKGSSLRTYAISFLLCLITILLFSIWSLLARIFNWEGLLRYPIYLFITISYIIFVYTAYKMHKLGVEFGFQSQATAIKKRLKKRKH